MKGAFSSGLSRTHSLSFHAARPSIWRELLARPHLIVAAVGTVALLGMSCTAIWLVLPGDPSDKIVTAAAAAPAAEQRAAAAKAEVDDSTTTATAGTPRAIDMTGKPGIATAAAPPKLAGETSPEPLDQTDPRWTQEQKAAAAKARSTAAATKGDNLASAYAEEPAAQADEAATAAIPTAKPKAAEAAVETAMVKPEAKAPDPAADDATEGRASRAARAVTMRAKPSTRGSPIGTVPARADVKVISCDQWCQIVYKGKRGYVYRSFLERNGR